MKSNAFSRRRFFFGSLLAGAVPAAGYGSVPPLKSMGYKSPNETLNVASIGAGGRPVHYEGKLLWDNKKGELTNSRDANRLVKPQLRQGWELRIS